MATSGYQLTKLHARATISAQGNYYSRGIRLPRPELPGEIPSKKARRKPSEPLGKTVRSAQRGPPLAARRLFKKDIRSHANDIECLNRYAVLSREDPALSADISSLPRVFIPVGKPSDSIASFFAQKRRERKINAAASSSHVAGDISPSTTHTSVFEADVREALRFHAKEVMEAIPEPPVPDPLPQPPIARDRVPGPMGLLSVNAPEMRNNPAMLQTFLESRLAIISSSARADAARSSGESQADMARIALHKMFKRGG
jgi:hypothetical protein